MKRYFLDFSTCAIPDTDEVCFAEMAEHIFGEYVKYEDVQPLIDAARECMGLLNDLALYIDQITGPDCSPEVLVKKIEVYRNLYKVLNKLTGREAKC